MHIPIICNTRKMGLGLPTQSLFLTFSAFLMSYENHTHGPEGEIKESLVADLIFLFHTSSQMQRLPLGEKQINTWQRLSLLGKSSWTTSAFVTKRPASVAVFLKRQKHIYYSLVCDDQQNLQKNTAWISSKC